MLDMRRANALQDSNPKVIENICQPAFVEATSTEKGSLRILHVDDDQTLIEVSKQILTIENNFEIESALSVKEAFQKLGKQNYDAIISDYEMPLKDGLDFLKELRQQQNDVPFILFTGKGREEVAVKALNLGADRYINKNGSPETVYCELADAINKTVKRKKTELEHKKSEEALIAASEKFKTIFENIYDVIAYVDTQGNIMELNNRVEDLLGYKPEEIIGKNFVSLGVIKLEDAQKLSKLFHGSLRKGEVKKIVELELKHRNGSKVIRRGAYLGTYADKNGKIVSIVNIFRDITENKKAEAAMGDSEKKFRKVFAIGHDAFLISTLKESTIIDVNERFAKMFGYTIGEAVGKSAIELGLWANLSDREKIASHLKSKGKIENIQISCRRKNGELFPILLSVSLIDANNQQFVLSTIRDLSTSKHAEDALKESEEKFRNLAEESPNIIFINKSGRIVYANKKSEEITGYTREELYSPNFSFLSLSTPENVESIKSFYSRHLKGEVTSPYDYELMSKDGKRINAIITSKLIEYEGEKAILGIVTDISELKKAEENLNQTMKELVSVNEKLGVVGNLTRHDVRNRMSVITGNIYLLKKKHSDNPEIMHRLADMERACESIKDIFDFAKMYEQIGVEELSLIDVKKTVGEAIALFSGSPNLRIINECNGLKVLADSFLRQLYYNLIDNSVKHGKRVTKIRVHYEKTAMNELNLIYEDDGVGVPVQNKPCLFNDGFSTSGSSGHGLFLIRKMMKVYGWSIEENGEPDVGAKFTITIPKLNNIGKENYQISK